MLRGLRGHYTLEALCGLLQEMGGPWSGENDAARATGRAEQQFVKGWWMAQHKVVSKTCVTGRGVHGDPATTNHLQVLKVAILAEKYAVEYTWYVDTILNLISIAGD
ncbi:hypothetical protein P7K49_032062 [Saguinus oedipus]|uniref:Uncharacterized protein n=1 Tax=Saguinus oedipus TaxID=9490 RepID=A0ABQ9TX80_SAGOE|nr:hypothetical protein P7K49_032062 [Saguinus oedipus]